MSARAVPHERGRPRPAPGRDRARHDVERDLRPDLEQRTRPPRPELRIVDEAGRRRRRRLKIAAWLVGTFGVILMFGAAVIHVLLTQSQFQLERIRGEIAAQQQEYEELRLQVARLSAPEEVVKVATNQLGMVAPEHTEYLLAPGVALATSEDIAAADGNPNAPAPWEEMKALLDRRP